MEIKKDVGGAIIKHWDFNKGIVEFTMFDKNTGNRELRMIVECRCPIKTAEKIKNILDQHKDELF